MIGLSEPILCHPRASGIQYSTADSILYWIPACAGMTIGGAFRPAAKLIGRVLAAAASILHSTLTAGGLTVLMEHKRGVDLLSVMLANACKTHL